MPHLIAYYLPTVLLAAATFLAVEWRVHAARGQRYRPLRRIPLALLAGAAAAVALRYA